MLFHGKRIVAYQRSDDADAAVVREFLPGPHHVERIAARQSFHVLDDQPHRSVEGACCGSLVERQPDRVEECLLDILDRKVKTDTHFHRRADGDIGVDVSSVHSVAPWCDVAGMDTPDGLTTRSIALWTPTGAWHTAATALTARVAVASAPGR